MNVAAKDKSAAPATALQPMAPEQVPAIAGQDQMLAMIERLATNPNANVETVERMMALYERDKAARAKAAYIEALVAMKPKLPVIDRKGRIEVRKKDSSGERTGAVQQSTPYAKWEDIDEAITPILAAHGFALTFRSGVASDGRITVTGVLGHKDGHSEETTMTLPHDSTGSKNQVQAVGSSTSYGKRYTATLLLNIRTKGEDDDGKAGGDPAPISDAQFKELSGLLDDVGADKRAFCKHMKIEGVAKLPASRFEEARQLIEAKRQQNERRQGEKR